jgi:hypothetical protein
MIEYWWWCFRRWQWRRRGERCWRSTVWHQTFKPGSLAYERGVAPMIVTRKVHWRWNNNAPGDKQLYEIWVREVNRG